mmetsp:Transcript_15915/g.40642  ORF Transcript_15915/g.40642 Transcript_15915/m.40642 type:complete len:239 (-) Transcript_15915:549-1265(-)
MSTSTDSSSSAASPTESPVRPDAPPAAAVGAGAASSKWPRTSPCTPCTTKRRASSQMASVPLSRYSSGSCVLITCCSQRCSASSGSAPCTRRQTVCAPSEWLPASSSSGEIRTCRLRNASMPSSRRSGARLGWLTTMVAAGHAWYTACSIAASAPGASPSASALVSSSTSATAIWRATSGRGRTSGPRPGTGKWRCTLLASTRVTTPSSTNREAAISCRKSRCTMEVGSTIPLVSISM